MLTYPLAADSWGEEELHAIEEVVRSGRFTMGDRVAKFEREFAEFFGARYSVMVNSGSSANLLMVAALFFRKERPLRRGDEVIVPAVSWATTYYPLHQYGLRMRWVDIDPDTLNYDLDRLRAAVSDRTRAIVAVNLLGNPNDFAALQQITQERDILLLEDNCESMGAQFDGRMAGTFGLMGTFSTFFSHHISTMEGGLVCTSEEELYHILLALRSHGWTRHLPDTNHVTGQKDADPFVESYNFVLPGYNLRPLEMQGAIGSQQLLKLPDILAARRLNAEHFVSLFQDDPRVGIQREIGASSWFGFSLVLREGDETDRRRLVATLERAGIESRPIVGGNFVKNPVMDHFEPADPHELPNADRIDRCGLFVGNDGRDLRAQIEHLRSVMDDAFAER